jgi:thiamine kinase-like enzyme
MEARPFGPVAFPAIAPVPQSVSNGVAAATSRGGGARAAVERYVRERFGASVRVREMELADADAGDKGFGYGKPIHVTLERLDRGGSAETASIVLHVARGGGFGHDSLADKAALSLLAWESYGAIPAHVRPLDVGWIEHDGALRSLAGARDFFFATEWADGRPYFHDLDEIAARGALDDRDLRRLDRLAANLAEIHARKLDDREAYRRRTRDLFGHHECIPGLLDSYDPQRAGEARRVPAELLTRIEERCVRWRWRLKERTHRLARVHGDYHPWNILFAEAQATPGDHGDPGDQHGAARTAVSSDRLVLLDCSRGIFGEPADDLAALSINYLFWALRTRGALVGPFAELWEGLFERYLARTDDRELLGVIPPYLAWRALVVASPVWYPRYSTESVPAARHADLDHEVRAGLLGFVRRVLELDRLDPSAVAPLLAAPADEMADDSTDELPEVSP